jgi:hypothetical protein
VPAGKGGLLASLSASLASSISSSLRKLGWFVEDSSLAHILSVILTLFRVDVTLCCPKKLKVTLMLKGNIQCASEVKNLLNIMLLTKIILLEDHPKISSTCIMHPDSLGETKHQEEF